MAKQVAERSSSEPVVWIGGEKGGVGKSFVSRATVDYLLSLGKKIFLIDTDVGSDVFKAYKEAVQAELVNVKEREEWMRLATLISENPDSIFVINTTAAIKQFVEESGDILHRAVKKLDRKLVTFWVLDRTRNSMEYLLNYMEIVPDTKMVILRNLYAGSEKKFELYNNSDARKSIEGSGGMSLNFPEVADRVTDAMDRGRLTTEKALKELPFGDRMELERWRDECKEMLTLALP
jgi:hypothetical protein